MADDPSADQPTDPDPQDPDQPPADPDQPQPAEPAQPAALYLDGVRGNDAGDGSQDDPVKTFARAKELAQADPAITSIYITGTVPIEGDISLAGTSAIIIRAPDFPDYLMSVARGKTATLHDITLDGNHEHAAVVDESLVLCQGTLTIADGATLRNNWLTRDEYNTSHGGGVTVDGGNGSSTAHLFMTGGTISGNKAVLGGGVHVYWKAAFDMTGGAITGNTAYDGKDDDLASGGGVCVYGGSTFRLSGGDITGNSSDCYGGGISVGTSRFSVGRDRLYMTGANVSGNKSGACGGGIFIQAGTKQTSGWAQISAGSICNNVMTGQGQGNKSFGGGIYVNGYSPEYTGPDGAFSSGTLKLTNAVISDNTAAMEGGGYAACPASDTKIHVKNGVAIYGNTAKAANEIYILASGYYGAHSGNPSYEISPVMLDGTAYQWKNQDGSERPLNELIGRLNSTINEELALHTDQSPASLEKAQVYITGNTSATRGGGIGSNGNVEMGDALTTLSLDVTKAWAGNVTQFPTSIEVEVWRAPKAGGQAQYYGFGTMTLDENGNGSLTFEKLPDDPDYVYTVKERPVPGYAGILTGSQDQGFVLTNVPAAAADLSVQKTVKGKPKTQPTFTFILTPVSTTAEGLTAETMPLPAQTQVSVTGPGTAEFGQMTFSTVGTYVYTVTEVQDSVKRWTYDDSTYTVTYLVEASDETQALTCTRTIEKDGSKAQDVVFTNTYRKPPSGGDNPPDKPDNPPDKPPDKPDNPPDKPDNPPDKPDNPPDNPDNPPDTPDNPPDKPDVPVNPNDSPNSPVTPDQPTQPNTPAVPDQPTTPVKPTAPAPSRTPATGDASGFPAALALLAASALALSLSRRRRLGR